MGSEGEACALRHGVVHALRAVPFQNVVGKDLDIYQINLYVR